MQPTLIRRCFVEFIATFAFILAIEVAVIRGISPLYISGIALALAISFYGHISGGHFNPSVTLALAVNRKISWVDVIPYWISQILGVGFSVLCVEKILDAEISTKFCELLQKSPTSIEMDIIMSHPFLLGILGTFLFISILLNIVATKFISPPFKGVCIGLSLIATCALFGPSANLSVNPARTLGPILFHFNQEPYFKDGLIIALASLVGGTLAGIVHSITHKEDF